MSSWTGKKLSVCIQGHEASTISWEQQEALFKLQQKEQLLKHPLVQKMQNAFPGFKLDT